MLIHMGETKNNLVTACGTDVLAKTGHTILKAVYADPGDRTWTIRNGTGAVAATGTVTLACALPNVFACGRLTVAFCCIAACDTVTVNGLTYTGVCGAKDCTDTEFSICTSGCAVATSLSDSIDDDTRTGTIADLSSTATCAVVISVSDACGVAGNAITQTVSNCVAFTCVEATFCGGIDADLVKVNGLVYTAVACAKANDTEFSIDTSNCLAATDLADSIDDDCRTGLTVPTHTTASTAMCALVTIVASPIGGTGNLICLSSTDMCTLVVSGAFFTGGDGDEVMTITQGAVLNGQIAFQYINRVLDKGLFIDVTCAGAVGQIKVVYE